MTTSHLRADDPQAFSLRTSGWSRYIDIAFLGPWIAGWFIFELGGLALLGGVLAGLVSAPLGITLPFASRIAPDGSAPVFLLFILFWLTLWTAGGIAAITHFLRSLAGQDVVRVSPDGVEVEWRAGPFRKRRIIPHTAIRRIRLGRDGTGLLFDSQAGTVDVTKLGTRDDRVALLAWLRERVTLPDETEARRLEAETVPPGWEVAVHGVETRLSQPLRRTRTIRAAILWTVAGLVAAGFLPSRTAESITGAHLSAAALGLLIALSAAWTTWGRSEWLVVPGGLTRCLRFGPWRREQRFEDAQIELAERVDSDGDHLFTLQVRSATARRKISTAIHDPAELTSLAEWLSARTRFPIRPPST